MIKLKQDRVKTLWKPVFAQVKTIWRLTSNPLEAGFRLSSNVRLFLTVSRLEEVKTKIKFNAAGVKSIICHNSTSHNTNLKIEQRENLEKMRILYVAMVKKHQKKHYKIQANQTTNVIQFLEITVQEGLNSNKSKTLQYRIATP